MMTNESLPISIGKYFLCILIILFLLPRNISASERNVIIVDNEGDGDYTTIGAAVNAATQGDTILVYSGFYNESVRVNKSLILSGVPEELGAGNDTGNPIIGTGGIGDVDVFTLTANSITIQGFIIKNSGQTELAAGVDVRSRYNQIKWNILESNRDGILISGNYNIIRNNIFYDNTVGAMIVGEDPLSNNIYDNAFVANGDNAIDYSYGLNDWNGNYWDDYTGEDENDDGYGDTAYYIEWVGIDYSPLMISPMPLVINTNSFKAFPSIQEALDDSETQNGHTIHVYEQDYWENIIISKEVILQRQGRKPAVIDAVSADIAVLLQASNSVLQGFTIMNASAYGIVVNASNNTITNNNFIDNTVHAIDEGTGNVWDNGWPLGGNYWDDYTGEDNNHGVSQNLLGPDGLGDTPRAVSESEDNYPLMFSTWVNVVNKDTGEYFKSITQTLSSPFTLNGHTLIVSALVLYENIVVNKSVTIAGRDASVSVIDGDWTGDTVKLSVPNVTITRLTIQHAGTTTYDAGVDIRGDNNRLFENVILENGKTGIRIENAGHNLILNNVIDDSGSFGHGIILIDSNVSGNTERNMIVGNTFTNHWGALWLTHPKKQNIIEKNTFYNNHNTFSASWTHSNVFFNNLFLENTYQGFDQGTDWFDGGRPLGGNYWIDYNGVDGDGDGYGDTPYQIPEGNNQDNYPFMLPNGWEAWTALFPESLNVFPGSLVHGDLFDLRYSEDNPVVINSGFGLAQDQPHVRIVITGHSSEEALSRFSFFVESSSQINEVEQKTELYNYQEWHYDLLDTRLIDSSEELTEIHIEDNPEHYIHPATGEVKARISWKSQGPIMIWPYSVSIDQLIWTLW